MQKQQKWNQHYQQAVVEDIQPCQVLQKLAKCLPASGRALDLACGLGGNACFLAEQGFDVEAVDFSISALEKLQAHAKEKKLSINTVHASAEDYLPRVSRFDVIVVSYFLQRSSIEPLLASLAPGGVLYYQTFYEEKPDDIGSNNPDYVLKINELLDYMGNAFIVRFYQQTAPFEQDDPVAASCMMLVAQKNA